MNTIDQAMSGKFSALLAGILVILAASPALAGEINTGYFGDVAIKGYDPVAYFTVSKAVKGSEKYSHRWLGAKWHFSSPENQKSFQATPVKFAPQYGGYCSDGVAYGQATANIDPEAWRIIDGKLYLNFDPGSAQELEELEGQLEKAEANWPAIKKTLAAN
jgi:YHS domain-containing protein